MRIRSFVVLICILMLMSNFLIVQAYENQRLSLIDVEVLNEVNEVQVIHNADGYLDWGNKDYFYLTNKVKEYNNSQSIINKSIKDKELKEVLIHNNKSYFLNILKNEMDLLKLEITNLSNEYIDTSRGVKIYPPQLTGYLHILYTGKNNREEIVGLLMDDDIVNIDFEYKNKEFITVNARGLDTIGTNIPKEIQDKVLQDTMFVLDNIDLLPETFFNNIVIAISPYTFNNALGFTTSGSTKGRCEYITLGLTNVYTDDSRIIAVSNTLLHELGHVFHYDLRMGTTENYLKEAITKQRWNEYIDIYKGNLESMSTKGLYWADSPAEHFAEDFKEFFLEKLSKKAVLSVNENIDNKNLAVISNRDVNNPYNSEGFSNFMSKYLNKGKETIKNSFPDIYYINSNGWKYKLPLVEQEYILTTNNELIFEIDKSNSCLNNLSVRVTDEKGKKRDIMSVGDKLTVLLSKEGHYDIIICYDEGNKRFVRWNLKIEYDKDAMVLDINYILKEVIGYIL